MNKCTLSKLMTVLILACAFLLAGVSSVFADPATSNGNIDVSVPTEVPMSVDAEGKVVSASKDALRISNNGSVDVSISRVSASSSYRGFKMSVATGTSQEAVDDAWFNFDGAKVDTKDGRRELAAGSSLYTAWSVDDLDAAGNKDILADVARGKTMLSRVTYTFESTVSQDFATFCAEDATLRFYRDQTVPSQGDAYRGHVATRVFTGIDEEASFLDGPFADVAERVMHVEVVDEGITPNSMRAWFRDMTSLTSVEGLGRLVTKNVTSMESLFNGCAVLRAIDVSGLDTSSVTNTSWMFAGCSAADSIDLGDMDTANVTDMSRMFSQCTRLGKLDLSKFDTQKVTNMAGMFDDCLGLESVDLSNFTVTDDTVTAMMFPDSAASIFKSITVGTGWRVNTFKGLNKDITELFYLDDNNDALSVKNGEIAPLDAGVRTYYTNKGDVPLVLEDFAVYVNGLCGPVLYIARGADVPNVGEQFRHVGEAKAVFTDIDKEVDDGFGPFGTVAKKVVGVYIMDDGIKPDSLKGWFCDMNNLTTIEGLQRLDTSNVTSMRWMFCRCYKLSAIDITGLDTSNVTDMHGMFICCGAAQSIKFDGIDTSKVKDMGEMFEMCWALGSVDMSSFDLSSVSDMSSMFERCDVLTSVNMRGVNVTCPTTINRMFLSDLKLKTIDVSGLTVTGSVETSDVFPRADGSDLQSITVGPGWQINEFSAFGGGYDTFYYVGADGKVASVKNGQIVPIASGTRTYYTNKKHVPKSQMLDSPSRVVTEGGAPEVTDENDSDAAGGAGETAPLA